MSQPSQPDDQDQERLDPSSADTGIWPAITAVVNPTDGEADGPPAEEPDAPGPHAEDIAGSSVVTGPSGQTVEVGPRLLAAMSQINQLLDERLGALQILFDREVRAEATRERIVDRLHAELQEYKQDLMLKVQKPIFLDLIQLHDDLGKMMEARSEEDPDRAAILRGALESVRTAIEDILYRQGVEPFQNEGDEFDPRRQRAVTTVSTEEPDRNKTIAARIRPGFLAGDKLIRPEIVSVYALRR